MPSEISNAALEPLTTRLLQFCGPRVVKLDEIYHWNEPDTTALPPGVAFHPRLHWSNAKWTIRLKLALHAAYTKAANANARNTIARWAVCTWGGVKNHGPTTLATHVEFCSHDHDRWPWRGVASYSKILSVRDPSRYVIFDARVAAALNAVQMINGRPLRIRFPIPSGQNATIKKFAKLVKEHKAQHDIPKKEAYDTYLRTLAEVAKRLDRVDLYRIEMILFGLATRLARQLLSARQGTVGLSMPRN